MIIILPIEETEIVTCQKRRECKAVNFQAAARPILLCLWSTQSQMQGSKLILQYWWRVYAICNMHNTDNASSTKIINLASLWSVPLSPAFGKSKSPCNSPITICWFASQFKEPTLDWRHKNTFPKILLKLYLPSLNNNDHRVQQFINLQWQLKCGKS